MPERLGKSLLIMALVALFSVVAGGTTASATARAPHSAGSASTPSTSVIKGKSSAVAQPNLIGGVSGCYGQTDQPHPSSHVNGTVNVVARTVCPASDYVSVNQYRSRWYGWQGWGSGSNSAYGRATANAAGGCSSGDTYTYLAESYHEASGVGYAYTSNSRRFTCT
jgi:hypothetical protein